MTLRTLVRFRKNDRMATKMSMGITRPAIILVTTN